MPEEDIKAHEDFEKSVQEENDKQEVKAASLEDLSLDELKDLAKEEKIKDYSKLTKKELIDKLNEKQDK